MDQKEQTISLHGSVWMTVNGENLGGKGRMALLAYIAECGSITQAAKMMKMSYKAAWDAIDTMNNLAGEPLVERLTGGKGGGGTHLTQRGRQLLENFRVIETEHRQFIRHLDQQATGMADDFLLMKKIGMRTSARNQYLGTVARIKQGAVNDEIVLDITGGQQIIAIITHDSTEELGLAPGVEAFALIKASSVIVMANDAGIRLSARNQLQGEIARIQAGAVNTEMTITLPGGGVLAAMITNESAQALALHTGSRVTGVFKASSVILGVPV
ncbi:TOBE domain-containing protein [Undibacterium oligocarboniphilum]|uniref:TOBE domain-containing protein n=1 Tax=Undibacterium oligocarboniphilum TaxID=666702 RepID=A0A850QR20_9BURK|nr:TOBE domain-containing protein [Undibacterium oligocarboniphilum]MBC3871274.1 TOBE domain-containing protein [Undibacterium oligocarboniphilum]NVO79250.1 TOBE domain-containing protein [Undibacterium oligocarboniphilum]